MVQIMSQAVCNLRPLCKQLVLPFSIRSLSTTGFDNGTLGSYVYQYSLFNKDVLVDIYVFLFGEDSTGKLNFHRLTDLNLPYFYYKFMTRKNIFLMTFFIPFVIKSFYCIL